jgi:hypothetical protein
MPRLSAFAMRFIRHGELDADKRAVSVFRVAAELGEHDCPTGLAHALLTEPARDSGLTESETRRQIDCGLDRARRQREGGAS